MHPIVFLLTANLAVMVHAEASPSAVKAGKNVEGFTFSEFVLSMLQVGLNDNVGSGRAKLIGVPPNAPEKLSELDGTDNLERISELILDPSVNEPKPICLLLVAAERDRIKGEKRSYYFRLSPDGVLEKSFLAIAKLDENGKAIRGSGVAQAKDIDSVEIKERLKHEFDFWLKGKYRRKQETGTVKNPEEAAKPALTSDVDIPSYAKAENPDNFAVIVGVEKYAALPEAQFAERDAAAVRAHLRAMGYPERNIHFLSGQEASRAGLVKNLETWLPNVAAENSTVFFYYSGHGAPDLKSGQAYLVPVDGDPEYLKDTGYSLKRLYQELNALKAKRVIVALDACFSGLGGRSVLAKGVRPLVTKVDAGLGRSGRVVAFSASGNDQISGTITGQGHGAFTYYFLKGLNGGATDKDGKVTVKSLYDYLAPKVADSARQNNRDQTPRLLPASLGTQGQIVLR